MSERDEPTRTAHAPNGEPRAASPTDSPTSPPPTLGAASPTPVPGVMRRWGPASWWRLGLLALLGLMVLLLVLGGGFWQAEPVDVPR